MATRWTSTQSRSSRQTARLLPRRSGLTALAALLLAILLPVAGVCQKKISLRVKTFDQTLKPVGNIEISLNNSSYFMIGSKGTAIVELNESDTKITSVRVKDESIEPASWNVSKGVVEIVIRPKSYRVLRFVLRLPDGKSLPGASITYQGSATIKSKSDPAGKFVLQLPVKERVRSADQFRVQDFQVIGLTLSETESILNVKQAAPLQVEVPRQKQRVKQAAPVQAEAPNPEVAKPASGINTATLDSISSLVSFYAMVRNTPMSSLTVKEKSMLDAKFKALLSNLKQATPVQDGAPPHQSEVSETSNLDDDIDVLLREAVSENDAMQTRRGEFENKAALLSQKLETGMESRSAAERAVLLADIDSLERLFVENEAAFNQTHNDRREIINALREKYWNVHSTGVSLNEAQEAEQRQARQRLIGIIVIIVAFVSLVILLIKLYSKLGERTLSLQQAKRKIEQDNDSIEEIVRRQTRLLSEQGRELNSVLNRSSQDLRSLLRSIIALSKVIEQMPNRELVGRVDTAAATMERVLNRLIDISAIGQEPGNIEHVKLIDVINKVKNHASMPAAGETARSLQFKVNCGDDVTLYTDRSLLEIVLKNLVENAIQFSLLKEAPGSAIVEVVGVTRGDMLELSVYDNGVGISRAAKSKLFNISATGNEEGKGNGLGLYAVRKAVLAMHGKIDVMTEEGVFTRVVVMIPRGQQTPRRAPATKEENVLTY